MKQVDNNGIRTNHVRKEEKTLIEGGKEGTGQGESPPFRVGEPERELGQERKD